MTATTQADTSPHPLRQTQLRLELLAVLARTARLVRETRSVLNQQHRFGDLDGLMGENGDLVVSNPAPITTTTQSEDRERPNQQVDHAQKGGQAVIRKRFARSGSRCAAFHDTYIP